MLATALVISAIALGLIITAEYPSRTYFAMTDPDGTVIDNTSRTVGTTMDMMLHMKNGEDGVREFMMSASGNSSGFLTTWHNKTLEKGEVWNVTISANLTSPGIYRFDFDLYIQEEGKPRYFYGNLHIWVKVS